MVNFLKMMIFAHKILAYFYQYEFIIPFFHSVQPFVKLQPYDGSRTDSKSTTAVTYFFPKEDMWNKLTVP